MKKMRAGGAAWLGGEGELQLTIRTGEEQDLLVSAKVRVDAQVNSADIISEGEGELTSRETYSYFAD